MIFRDLDIGEGFFHWDEIDGCYYMYKKNSEYDGYYVDRNLIERDFGRITFGANDIVYKVIV